MEKDELKLYYARLDQAFYKAMKTLGPKVYEKLEHNLTGEQFFVLNTLEQKGRITSSQLAEELQVKPSAITAMVDRLLKNDFVIRERDEKDRRAVYVRISDEGRRALKSSVKKRNIIMEKYMSKLTEEEMEQLTTILEKLTTIIIESES
jgi:DNA-binding MarR family transcriptional regulator